MLEKDFILNKTRCLLNEFINPIIEKADKPRKKFLRQAIGAILVSGSLIVTEYARWIHDDCSDTFYRVKRLLNHMVSPRGDLTDAVQSYRKSVSAYLKKKRILPLALNVYSIEDPAVGSQNLQIDRTVKAVDKAVNGSGIWFVYYRLLDGL